jgi:hypothetical protein
MSYYRCSQADLTSEIQRRGFQPCGDQDRLSEDLKKDDDARGSEATTVSTIRKQFVPPKLGLARTAEFGATEHAHVLVGERESTCRSTVWSSTQHSL